MGVWEGVLEKGEEKKSGEVATTSSSLFFIPFNPDQGNASLSLSLTLSLSL